MVNRARQKLTERQKKVLDAVKDFIQKHGYSPTVRQLARILGIPSPSAVFKHLSSIEKKGYLRKENGDIQLAGQPSSEPRVQVPLAGLVPAGDPKEVFDTSEDAVDIPEWMLGRKKGNVFCVQVEGKSMVDAFIDDGDRVLLERTHTANSGEMVVAVLDDGSITLKRLKLEDGDIFLVPENPEFEPLKVSKLKIIGRVIGVLRKY
ncbi:MAG: transcriptional repressor LexA [Acidobacteriota bacterium]